MHPAFASCALDRRLDGPAGLAAHISGRLVATDATGFGGIALVDPASGDVVRHLSRRRPLAPAAVALEDGGTVLLATSAARAGGVVRLHPDGDVEPVLVHADGVPLPPTTGLARRSDGLIFATVPTRRVPQEDATRAGVADGFVVTSSRGVARIGPEGLAFPTACLLSPDEAFLFVAETFGRRVSRCAVGPGGRVGAPEPVATFGGGIFPTALAFDDSGGLLVGSHVSATVLRVGPDGRRRVVCAAPEAAHVAAVEHAFANLQPCPDAIRHDTGPLGATGLAFGGAEQKTLWFASPSAARLVGLDVGFRGARTAGFDADLGPLARLAAANPARPRAMAAAG